jgi:RHS repeat-associated protein
MLYDGVGQRVAKTVNGQTARYLWNGGEILKEYAPDGTTKAEYLLGMGREAIKVGGAWKFYLKDIQGSTLGLVDAQGHVTDTYEYSDYGDTISRTGNSYNPFLYTGQELDTELGMYHLRARHYSPTLSRFIARDPIGYAGGSNLYAYCNGDPINASDPSGLQGDCDTWKVRTSADAKIENGDLKVKYRAVNVGQQKKSPYITLKMKIFGHTADGWYQIGVKNSSFSSLDPGYGVNITWESKHNSQYDQYQIQIVTNPPLGSDPQSFKSLVEGLPDIRLLFDVTNSGLKLNQDRPPVTPPQPLIQGLPPAPPMQLPSKN